MTNGNISEDNSRGIAIDLESAEEGIRDMAPHGDMMVSTSFIVLGDDETTIWIKADGGRVQVMRDE